MKYAIAGMMLLVSGMANAIVEETVTVVKVKEHAAVIQGFAGAVVPFAALGIGALIASHEPHPDAYKSVSCSAGGYNFTTTKLDATSKGLNCK